MSKLDMEVKLVGEDGNIFNLMGIVSRQMKKHGHEDHRVEEFINDVTSSQSYDEALQKIAHWVKIL